MLSSNHNDDNTTTPSHHHEHQHEDHKQQQHADNDDHKQRNDDHKQRNDDHHHHHHHNERHQHVTRKRPSIIDIISNRDTCMMFYKHLKEAHAEEALNFFVEVELYKKATRVEDLETRCKEILHKYLKPNSMHEINVDGQLRAHTDHAIETHSSAWGEDQRSVFDGIQTAILDLLDTSPLPTFVNSKPYKKYTSGSLRSKSSSMSPAFLFTKPIKRSRSETMNTFERYFDVMENAPKTMKSPSNEQLFLRPKIPLPTSRAPSPPPPTSIFSLSHSSTFSPSHSFKPLPPLPSTHSSKPLPPLPSPPAPPPKPKPSKTINQACIDALKKEISVLLVGDEEEGECGVSVEERVMLQMQQRKFLTLGDEDEKILEELDIDAMASLMNHTC